MIVIAEPAAPAVAAPWLGVPDDHRYGIANLPYGVGAVPRRGDRVLVRIGDRALDLTAAWANGEHAALFAAGSLDPLLAAGPARWRAVRAEIISWLSDPAARDRVEPNLLDLDAITPALPFTVADYVDFYASQDHATNVGKIFRPDGAPLTPNWKHLPIGYHGRAGTVLVSGTPVPRPSGQFRTPDGEIVFGPSRRLDIEAEVGFVVGTGSTRGTAVSVDAFAEHVFGVCLVNDWSARDIQAWEYVPLGPFLGKSFATSAAAWITPLEALSAAWVAGPVQNPRPLDYLIASDQRGGLELALQIRLNGQLISSPDYARMYWTPAQMLAHMTINGASLRSGDLYASGTVSGPVRDQRGCLLEITWGGKEPLGLADGTTRAFLADGDEVTISATAPGPYGPIALAEVSGVVAPAR